MDEVSDFEDECSCRCGQCFKSVGSHSFYHGLRAIGLKFCSFCLHTVLDNVIPVFN